MTCLKSLCSNDIQKLVDPGCSTEVNNIIEGMYLKKQPNGSFWLYDEFDKLISEHVIIHTEDGKITRIQY